MCGNEGITAYPTAFVKGFLPFSAGNRRIHPAKKETAPFASETAGKTARMEGIGGRRQRDERAGREEKLLRFGVKGIRLTVISPGFGQEGVQRPILHPPERVSRLQCPAGVGKVRRERKNRAVIIPRPHPFHQFGLRERLNREVKAEIPLPKLGNIGKKAGNPLVFRQEDGEAFGLAAGGAGAVEGGVDRVFRQFHRPQPLPQPGRQSGPPGGQTDSGRSDARACRTASLEKAAPTG